MKRLFFVLVLLSLSLSGAWAAGLAGTYSATREVNGDSIVVSVELSKEDGAWSLSGGAGYDSGKSAAPSFTGEFEEEDEDGTLRFKFEDSFENKGTIEVKRRGSGLAVSFDITTVEEERCLPLYRAVVLQKE